MPTLEEVRAKIKRNFPDLAVPKGNQILVFEHETARTLVDTRGWYRICKVLDDKNEVSYTCWTIAWGKCPAEQFAGPMRDPKKAREACQAHLDGEPIQASL